MENPEREKNRKRYVTMRMIYDVTVAILILGIGAMMLLGTVLQITYIQDLDPTMRYFFGSLCILYGGFRLYRGIKKEY